MEPQNRTVVSLRPLPVLLGFSVFFILGGLDLPASAQTAFPLGEKSEETFPIQATADSLEYVKGEKKIVARGNAVITYQATKLTADYAEVFTDTKKAYAEGHVTISFKEGMLRGEKVYYDFKTHQGSFPDGTAISYPWFSHAEQMDQISKDEVRLYNANLTTCPLDQGDPHYEIIAKRAIVYPGKNFIAYDVKFKILGKTDNMHIAHRDE